MTLWLVRSGTGHMAQGRINADMHPCPTIMAEGLGGGNCSQYWLEEDDDKAMILGVGSNTSYKPYWRSADVPSPIIATHPDPDEGGAGWMMTDKRPESMQTTPKPPYRVPSMADIAAIPWNGCNVASVFSGCGGSALGYRMAGYRVLWANEFVPAAQATYRLNHPETFLDTRDIRQVQVQDILAQLDMASGELDLFDGSPPCQAFSTAGKREKGWGKDKTYEHGAKQKNETLFTEYIRLLRGLMPRVFVAENVSGLVKGVAKGYFKEILAALKACGYRVEARLLDAQWLGVPQMRSRIIFVGVRSDLDMKPVFPQPLPYRYSVREALPTVQCIYGTGHGFGANGFHVDKPSPTVSASMQSPWNAYAIQGQKSFRAYRDTRGAFGHDGDCTDMPAPAVLAGSVGTHWITRESVIHDTGNFASCIPITETPCPAITIGVKGSNATHYLVAGQGQGDTVTSRQPDGIVRRKFTIAELKRICAFPDDFQLTGSYAQQWERLGNAVPPIMMQHIAQAIARGIFPSRVHAEKDA